MLETLLYAILVALLVILTVAGGTFLGWWAIQRVKAKLPAPVTAPPAAPARPSGQPPVDWWDSLQTVVTAFNQLRGDVNTELQQAKTEREHARAAEERTRSMLRRRKAKGTFDDDDDDDSALTADDLAQLQAMQMHAQPAGVPIAEGEEPEPPEGTKAWREYWAKRRRR